MGLLRSFIPNCALEYGWNLVENRRQSWHLKCDAKSGIP